MPEPEAKYEQTGLWMTFHFLPEHQGKITIVTGEVNRLLLVCWGAMSRRELREALVLKRDDNFRRLYLIPALKAGVIEMAVPDKPNSRLQKYRLTAKGGAIQASLQRGKPT
jgi:ATP-dependent DNA helicase RecG